MISNGVNTDCERERGKKIDRNAKSTERVKAKLERKKMKIEKRMDEVEKVKYRLTSRAGVLSRVCVDCVTSAAWRLLWKGLSLT